MNSRKPTCPRRLLQRLVRRLRLGQPPPAASAWNHRLHFGRHIGPVVRENAHSASSLDGQFHDMPSRVASLPMIVSYRGRPCDSGPVRRVVRP